MIISGNMYCLTGNKKITDKLLQLQKIHPLIQTNPIQQVVINSTDGEREGLSDGFVVDRFIIKLSKVVLTDNFWFIINNNFESGLETENKE